MVVLVIGRVGQLAQSLAEKGAAYPSLELCFAARPELDLAVPGSARAVIERVRPRLVVNTAAFTAVDRAEEEPDLANRVNADAAGEVAAAAAAAGAAVIHLSTDYVFGGNGSSPIDEAAAVGPLGVYGRSKAGGETLVRAANPDHLILRTAWLYSPFGHNFVKTMLRLASHRHEVAVVADQMGSPTGALDLADAILSLAKRRLDDEQEGWGETYHAAGHGHASWAEFAAAVFEAARTIGGPVADVIPISTDQRPGLAARPRDSRLNSTRLHRQFGIRLPAYGEALPLVVERLLLSGLDCA